MIKLFNEQNTIFSLPVAAALYERGVFRTAPSKKDHTSNWKHLLQATTGIER